MRRFRLRAVASAACLAALALATPIRAAAAPPCEFDNVDRIVAVGDVHGAYDRFLEILRAAEVIDAGNHWSGGKTHLVQVGDVLDRGPDSLKVLTFLRQLEGEAQAAGGKLHWLIGNHEAMRLMGDLRYVTPGEYEAFITKDSPEVRRRIIESRPENVREQFAKEVPLGMVEMIRAFVRGSDYGTYVRGLNAVIRINGIVFAHGGISPSVAPLTCAAINETVVRELGADLEQTMKAPLESLAAREDGPLWYRGLANEPDTFAPEVDKILEAQGARAIVVGHTVQGPNIVVRFGGRVFVIDTGMQPAYRPQGRASALEIRGDTFTAIYKDSRQVIHGGAAEGHR